MNLVYVPPPQLHAAWPQARVGVTQIWLECGEPWLPEDVYAEIKSGAASLWMRPDGSGFVVLKVQADPYSGVQSLLVWIAWSAPGTEAVVAQNTEQVRAIARQMGISRLVFESPRRGWERRAPALGWQADVTRYVMEA